MKTLTPRQRVLRALTHQEVDRAPIDLGGTHNSTMGTGAYNNLKASLGIDTPTTALNQAFDIVRMDERVLARLPVDTRAIFANPPAHTQSRWLDERTLISDWGVTYRRPEGWHQFDVVAHPLAEATLADLDHYPWPDVDDPARYAGLAETARDLHENSPYAVCATAMDTVIFDRAWELRGMQQFLEDLLIDPEFALALLEKVADLQYRRHSHLLREVGKYIDVVVIADDMGVQKGLLLRPQLYRKMIKPFHARYVQVIRQYTDAKILNHACGSIVDLVEDYIEIGIDALNPMQVSAAGMSPQNLKARFGGRMAFWGGIDTQYVLPKGSPDDVRQAVRSTLDVMGLDGGYVLGAVHNVQDDVPAANVWAMLDEASTYRPAGKTSACAGT
jgi:uroporphyrinogen decarboxylase